MKEKRSFMLFVTNLEVFNDDQKCFMENEKTIKENLQEYRVRFFHPKFQGKDLTLNRILREEKDEIHIVFQKGLSCKKSLRIIKHINETKLAENIIFSTSLQF